MELFAALERKPYLWVIPGLSTPGDIVARLAANGFVDQGGGYDMILLRNPDERPAVALPREAVLERWNDPSDADRPALEGLWHSYSASRSTFPRPDARIWSAKSL